VTATTASVTTLEWNAPGKGEWRGLHDHFPRALTPEYQHILAAGMEAGEAIYMADYGFPIKTLHPAFVHGRVFVTPASLVGPQSNRLPPAALLWVAARVVPALRRRAKAARHALAERRWLDETAHWYDVERPAWIARNAALDAIDPASLDDAALVAHLCATRANVTDGYREHFRLHGPDLIPTALFLVRAGDWGIDPHDAVALLAGSSPASRAEAPLPQWRIVSGYDLDERCAAELPTMPSRSAMPRPERGPTPVERPAAVDDAELRGRVPAPDRAEWDIRLADARATYGLRDDNGLLTGAWPMGLLRRTMLEAGRRLVASAALATVEHAIELTVDELVDALTGSPRVSAAEVAARATERARLSAESAPAVLGPEAALPLAVLPSAMGLMVRALLAVRDLGGTVPGERPPLEGVGIGDTAVVARACVAIDPAEAMARFEPGDILVTASTCPMWNAVLAVAGGVVTEEGGPLSHAAVIARELGLPALIGAAEATSRIPDGAQIELDPSAGRVSVVTLTR
jgi:pyruvate,water dikinase